VRTTRWGPRGARKAAEALEVPVNLTFHSTSLDLLQTSVSNKVYRRRVPLTDVDQVVISPYPQHLPVILSRAAGRNRNTVRTGVRIRLRRRTVGQKASRLNLRLRYGTVP
jgi:hypothetical protein